MRIKTFGPVDERSLQQLKRCMEAGDAELGVLCADHHPGYSQPIGGGIAYEGHVSPSGVGFDIGCIAAGARVTTTEGWSLAIDEVSRADAVACLDDGRLRRVEPNLGAVPRGTRAVRELILVNGRRLTLTPDHRVRTLRGWTEVDGLVEGDLLLCSPFVGLPHGDCDHDAALLRILGYVCGDGHGTLDGKRVCVTTTVEEDASSLLADLRLLGVEPRIYRRARAGTERTEIHVATGSQALHEQLAGLGSPVGRKRLSRAALSWLFEAPSWARAAFLSAFASAETSTPLRLENRLANLAWEQADPGATAFVADLVVSLGFRCSLSQRGAHGVVEVVGGEEAQLRFLEDVGFCHAVEKRRAAAAAASVAWRRRALLAGREDRREAALVLRAAGMRHREAVERVADLHAAPSFPSVHGEGAWVAVRGVAEAGRAAVWDVATGDPAGSFLAEGVVVHNCGNKAARTDLTRADLDALGGVERVMGEITRRISFGMGVPARERVDHPVLEKIRTAEFAPQRRLANLAAEQLGTVGGGNHYVDVLEDEDGRIWVGVHFGSRGFGHKTASGFLALAQGLGFGDRASEGGMDAGPTLFPIDSELGRSYVSAMKLAGEYAYAGRDVVVAKVLEILGAEATHEVHNHHNFAWLEEHFGRRYWVVRKGCTPARPGQEGFVGGSMGDESVVLEGVAGDEAEESLYSTVHGAGRVMSRSQAAGRTRRRKVVRDGRKEWVREQVQPGLVDWPAVQERLRRQGIVLVGGGADEAPEVYKRLPDVLAAHAGSVRMKHRLRPLGVAMAGRDVVDPYKD